MKQVLFLAIIFLGIAWNMLQNIQTTTPPDETTPSVVETYEIVSIIDGDTILVRTATGEERVRLIGIDAPETNVTNNAVECFGLEATQYLKDELANETVTLELDPSQDERDTYGRLLAYVFLNGNNINQALVSGGYAKEFTFNTPYRYQKEFREAETAAKQAQKGVWSPACTS
jgi:micrococcal nuclease